MKTLWIEDEDALNVGRVIVTKTGTKDCVVCYSCDERDDYEARLKADMVAMLEEFDLELSEYEDADLIRVEYIRQDIQERIDKLKEDNHVDKAQ